MSTKKVTPGRRRLFQDEDRVQVSLPNEKARFAAVSQYDTSTRKMLVRYEGNKTVDKNWINIKYVARVDGKGKIIPKPVRSASRGRSASASRSKSPTKKKTVSGRTRSKSRERQPTAAFSADEEATGPIKVKAKKTPSKKDSPKKPARKASPARTPKKATAEATPKRSTEKKKLTATPLKDAEFSADEEEVAPVTTGGDELAKLAEENSKENDDAPPASAKPGVCQRLCGAVCCLSKCVCSTACSGGQFLVKTCIDLWNLIVLFVRLSLLNLPNVIIFAITAHTLLFLVDKKNLRTSSFYPDPKLAALPVERLQWTWLSSDPSVWKSNFMGLWAVLKYPVLTSAIFYSINYLKEQCLPTYKIRLVSSGSQISTQVNLRKLWLSVTAITAFIMYTENMMPYFDKLMPFANPVTPVLKSYFLCLHAHAYDGLCVVFRNTSKFYFYLVVLALFKSYQDFDFDLDISWKSWFLNTEDTTSGRVRFLVNYTSELFLQTSFLVLAARNPTNMYLWILFNSRFVLQWLATRGDTEELSVRRLYQNTNLSGFHFYASAIIKVFCFTNVWRFISKPERVTACPYRLTAFAFFQVFSFLFTALATRDYPSDKRNGIHGVIRQGERLADICSLAAMTALNSPSFGNVPCWVLGMYCVNQVVDSHWQEEAQLVKSRSKWEAYFGKVTKKFMPKVY